VHPQGALTRERERRHAPWAYSGADRGYVIKSRSRGGLVCLPAHSTQAPGVTCPARDVHLGADVSSTRCATSRCATCPSTIRGHVAPGAMASAQRESSTRRRLDHIPLPDPTFCAAFLPAFLSSHSFLSSLSSLSCSLYIFHPLPLSLCLRIRTGRGVRNFSRRGTTCQSLLPPPF